MIKLNTPKTSLDKKAALFSGRAKCTDCLVYKKNNNKPCLNETLLSVCDYAFRKGFISGYKHHRKLVKNK